MSKQRELRDPIHGFIQRSEIEEKLIDSTVFQRLRGIKQLAMAHLVYPGAMHTRFGHSVGVMHVAGRLARQLIDDGEKERIIRLAALLHDIGHGPFSHVSEDILDRYYDKGKVQPKTKERIHEHVTCSIIEKNPEIAKLVSEHERAKIIGLLQGTAGESIERGIVSGPLDADKQDYLLRDSYFCGVKYGIFDIERLIGTLQVYSDKHDQCLSASPDGVHAIEQFVLAKYYMSTQVYRHKIRLITDSMIIRALELGLEVDELPHLKKLFEYDGSDEFVENYLQWDDARLTTSLLYPLNEGGLATQFFWRLKNRLLFKVVFRINLREFEGARERELLSNIPTEVAFRKVIECQIAEYLSSKTQEPISQHDVIVNVFAIKSVLKESRNDEGSIIIVTDGSPGQFENESTLFRSIVERESDRFIEIYAPMTYSDEVDKRRKLAVFERDIKEMLAIAAAGELEGRTQDKERSEP